MSDDRGQKASIDDLFDGTPMSLLGMTDSKSSFRLGAYTRFILEATGFDIHGHIATADNHLYADEIEDLLRGLRECDAPAHGKWLHDTRPATEVLNDLVLYFELCLEHDLTVLLL